MSGHGKNEIPEEIRKFLNSNHLYEDLTINGERNKSSSLAGFMSETAKRIVDCCINNNKRESYKILEIGGGIGLLSIFISSMLKKRGIENIEYTHIDLPETSLLQKKLIRSYWSNVKTTTSGSSITNITKKITFKIIDTNTELPENKYDCIINIMSMCEMDDINALKYVDYINLSCNIGAIVFFSNCYGMATNSINDVADYPFSAKLQLIHAYIDSPTKSLQDEYSQTIVMQSIQEPISVTSRTSKLRRIHAEYFSATSEKCEWNKIELNRSLDNKPKKESIHYRSNVNIQNREYYIEQLDDIERFKKANMWQKLLYIQASISEEVSCLLGKQNELTSSHEGLIIEIFNSLEKNADVYKSALIVALGAINPERANKMMTDMQIGSTSEMSDIWKLRLSSYMKHVHATSIDIDNICTRESELPWYCRYYIRYIINDIIPEYQLQQEIEAYLQNGQKARFLTCLRYAVVVSQGFIDRNIDLVYRAFKELRIPTYLLQSIVSRSGIKLGKSTLNDFIHIDDDKSTIGDLVKRSLEGEEIGYAENQMESLNYYETAQLALYYR